MKNIAYRNQGYYVSNEGTEKCPNYHVWIPCVTHAVCDSSYNELSLAIARCDYLAKTRTTINYQSITK